VRVGPVFGHSVILILPENRRIDYFKISLLLGLKTLFCFSFQFSKKELNLFVFVRLYHKYSIEVIQRENRQQHLQLKTFITSIIRGTKHRIVKTTL